MTKVFIIAGAGAAGAVCRYGLATVSQRLADTTFPVGTLTVNLMGCFLIGFLGWIFAGPVLVREEYRFALLIGFLGAFTTFSSYGLETFSLLNDGQKGAALANILLSNAAGLALVWVGYRLAEHWYGG